MSDLRQKFFRTVAILNSLLISVFILFMIDKLGFLFFQFGLNYIQVFLILLPFKVYCLSALGAGILEIISAEQIVFRFRRWHHNAITLAPGFLIVFAAGPLIDFLLFALFPSFRLFSVTLLEVVFVIFLAQWAAEKKYIASSGIMRRRVSFNLGFLIMMLLVLFLEFLLARGAYRVPVGGLSWLNMNLFVQEYIRVFEFIFVSLYIFDHYPEISEKFREQKEIFLIFPMGSGIIEGLGSLFFPPHPPFFAVLKALSPKTYQFREFTRNLWHERYYKSDVLVCISCFTSNCYEAYKIAKEFRSRGAKVVMGGPHVTYLPEEALAFCDSVVIGPAEGVWGSVIRDYENGELKARYEGPATEADFAKVHEGLLNSPAPVIKDFLETMRGCKFRCHFCTIPSLSGGKVHLQPIEAFVELIKKIRPRYPDVSFIDNNIYADPGYSKELFAALKPLKIKWTSACSIDIAKNQETLKLARESGCVLFLIGYEVYGGSSEMGQGGKFGMAQKYIEYTKAIKKSGIQIKGMFIFGFDSDNLKTLFDLWRFCFSIMPLITVVSLLTPFPGSGVYRDMLEQDRIISLNWRSYGCSELVVRHPHMNPALLSFFFPFIRLFFIMTTSYAGLTILFILVFFPYRWF